jgi:hypothetical protein
LRVELCKYCHYHSLLYIREADCSALLSKSIASEAPMVLCTAILMLPAKPPMLPIISDDRTISGLLKALQTMMVFCPGCQRWVDCLLFSVNILARPMLLSFLYFKDIGKVHQVRGSGKIAYPIPNRLTIPHFCSSTPTQKVQSKGSKWIFILRCFSQQDITKFIKEQLPSLQQFI